MVKIAKLIVWGIVTVLGICASTSAQQHHKIPSAAKEALELLMSDTTLPSPELMVTIKFNQLKSNFELRDLRPFPDAAGQDPKQVDYPASHLLIPIDTSISFIVTAEDDIYEIKAAKLGIEMTAILGRISEKIVTVSKPGLYKITCSEDCDPANDIVYLNIHAVDEITYWAWYRDYRAKQH